MKKKGKKKESNSTTTGNFEIHEYNKDKPHLQILVNTSEYSISDNYIYKRKIYGDLKYDCLGCNDVEFHRQPIPNTPDGYKNGKKITYTYETYWKSWDIHHSNAHYSVGHYSPWLHSWKRQEVVWGIDDRYKPEETFTFKRPYNIKQICKKLKIPFSRISFMKHPKFLWFVYGDTNYPTPKLSDIEGKTVGQSEWKEESRKKKSYIAQNAKEAIWEGVKNGDYITKSWIDGKFEYVKKVENMKILEREIEYYGAKKDEGLSGYVVLKWFGIDGCIVVYKQKYHVCEYDEVTLKRYIG